MFAPEWVRPATPRDAVPVRALLRSESLEDGFVPGEFVVAESDGAIVGCARAKRLPEGGTELASVAVVAPHRGRGLARSLVTTALLGARHPVYCLTLVPELATRAGFEPIAPAELPASLVSKASTCDCGGKPWRAMRMKRVILTAPPPEVLSGRTDFFDP